MQAVLIIIHLLVAMALIFVVLLQRSEGGALGMGGGGSGLGGLFSPRGAANTLTRTTAILGLAFFLTSMSLTLLSLGTRQPTSILNQAAPGQTAPAPGAPPALPSATPPTLPAATPPSLPSAVPPAPPVEATKAQAPTAPAGGATKQAPTAAAPKQAPAPAATKQAPAPAATKAPAPAATKAPAPAATKQAAPAPGRGAPATKAPAVPPAR